MPIEQEGRNVGEDTPRGEKPQRNRAQGIKVGLHGAELRSLCGGSSRNTGCVVAHRNFVAIIHAMVSSRHVVGTLIWDGMRRKPQLCLPARVVHPRRKTAVRNQC